MYATEPQKITKQNIGAIIGVQAPFHVTSEVLKILP